MSSYLSILTQVIFPIILLIGVGVILHRRFQLDMNTLSKLIMYFFLPAMTFIAIYEASISLSLLKEVVIFLLLQLAVLHFLGKAVSKLLGLGEKSAASFNNSIILSNNGNIGIPVNDLAFRHDPLAMSVQMVVVLFEVVLAFTYGLFNASTASIGLKTSLITFVKLPIVYALVSGMLLHMFQVPLPSFVLIPLHTVANSMLAVALVSIGAQVARLGISRYSRMVLSSSLLRLVAAPLCAYVLLRLLNMNGVIAQALLICSALPTSRNSAALALEYGNEPEFAAQAVLASTLLSSLTLTFVIDLSTRLF
ncbi:AEC family transporter [Brevibacillus ruminantium]|uniref:AEC family transporter n=1 Tax=Brevibacillus ruminantium TaxID=2950604 RepID=A0ABY4W9J7_9BACL|nr:AEC family transporter [Brevibacillus ruminantium]USG63723.1 AEC family transporter [Brevibacillus ruminantium]